MENSVKTDVLIVGGGPSGLATAISLANSFKKNNLDKNILLIEKGSSIGSHILSGAIIKPTVFKEFLNDEEFKELPFEYMVGKDDIVMLNENSSFTLPISLPFMSNEGNFIASLSKITKYLAKVAQDKGVEIYSGFAADSVIFENDKVVGIKTKDTGLDHNGVKQKNYQEGTTVYADIVVFAEGTRGSAVKQVIKKLNLEGKNPQVYSLGIKELWEVPNFEAGRVYHTIGYPLEDEFGGGFIYGLKDNKVAIGLVVGLDYKDPKFDPYKAMQIFKTHPFVKNILKDGKVLEAGAKTLPEGGWNSLIKYYGDNFVVVGDSAGFLSTASLKGIHLAIKSAICASEAITEAFKNGDTSKDSLKKYEEFVNSSFIYDELYKTRNFRALMSEGLILGGLKVGISLLRNGKCSFVPEVKPDSQTTKTIKEFEESSCIESFDKRFSNFEFDGKLTFDKVTMVYNSKTMHDEIQPVHLKIDNKELIEENIKEYGLLCESFCPAEVYELHIDKNNNKSLRIHAENCVHCKTCDIKSLKEMVTWTVPYGGNGPDYNMM